MTRPFGVKTKTSSCSRSTFRLAMNSVGIGGLGLPVDDAVQPRQVGGAAVVVLVVPVGGHAVLGPLVHLEGADLHLEGLALGPHHRRVQRLVEVELGHGDVVLEPPLHRLPRGVDGAQRGVAVLHRLDDDPDADEVEDVVEVAALHDHLLVDAPQVLRPAGDVGGDAQLGRRSRTSSSTWGEVEVRARGSGWRPCGRSRRSAWGAARRRRGPRAAGLHLLHAEAVGQRHVDVERLLRRCAPASTPAWRRWCACCGADRPA